MLKELYENKNIAIIGYQSVVGRILLKKLISYIHPKGLIYCLDLGKDKALKQKFLEDPYFTSEEKLFLKTEVEYVPLEEAKSKFLNIQINLLLNLFLPLDFSQEQKVINYHILQTLDIFQQLESVQIDHCVQLSYIFYRDPGYIS